MCLIKLQFRIRIPHHYDIIIVKFHINWSSGSRENIWFFFNPIWLPNHVPYKIIPEQAWTRMPWRTFVWSFPSILPAVLEKKIFYMFLGKSNMAAKPCDQWHHMCEPFVSQGKTVIHVNFYLDLFSHFREDFWRFQKKQKKQHAYRITCPMT